MASKALTFGIPRSLYQTLSKPTPKEYIKQRVGRGGMTFNYVEAGYVIEVLNRVFNGMWDFEIMDKQIGKEKVWVLGKLTIHIQTSEGVQSISKSQFGGADIKRARNETKSVIDIGDDMKAAASDALKKCASLFGVAKDVYFPQGFEVEL